jgi:FkbH-like protein
MAPAPASAAVISATFTAEPITGTLRFWLQRLDIALEIVHASYNQIFQNLLDPGSAFAANSNGINAVLLRWQDLGEPGQIEANARTLIGVIERADSHFKAPLAVLNCPCNPKFLEDPEQAALASRLDQLLSQSLAPLPHVHLAPVAEAHELYSVSQIYDPVSERIGQIPYTEEYFAALGTVLARTIAATRRPPYKVIATDLDNTLWGGVAGEDGVEGVRIERAHLQLQKFLLEQRDSGMLLAIVSKNNERDAWEVFQRRPEMLLKPDDFSAWRINWESKGANLRSLAGELSLGLDSFIFLDDDAKECAEVRAQASEALTLRLPAGDENGRFPRHVWAFDRSKTTAEDRLRNDSYRQERQRTAAAQSASNLEDFIASLDLRVTIEAMRPELLARVAQLTQRTNQFNTTAIRRTEAEIRGLLDSGKSECLTVAVTDRFGDYGNVGAVLYTCGDSTLEAESFLLSCRALGRGVEHQVVRRLGEEAKRRKLASVAIRFAASTKNAPALRFLESIGAAREARGTDGEVFRLPVEQACELAYRPGSGAIHTEAAAPEKGQETPAPERHTADYEEIANRWNTAAAVMAEVRKAQRSTAPVGAAAASAIRSAPHTDTERRVAEIWADLLGTEEFGIHDNFFDLGGHSLMATRVIARIADAFDLVIPLERFFEAPTVERLAAAVDHAAREQAEEMERLLAELEEQA